MTAKTCTATTKSGESCKAIARHDTGLCNAHSPREVQERSGFGGAQPGAGRPKTPRAVDVLRERIERDIDTVLNPLWEALAADQGIALQIKGGGMDLALIADHRTRIAAARELLDRAYGKPKQQTEVTGADGGPVALQTLGVQDAAERRAALKLLADALDDSE